MSCFPFFREITGLRALVVGGGEVALRRAKMLAEFGADVTCIASEFREEFLQLNVRCIQRGIELNDVFDRDIVIAATDNRRLNASVAAMAKQNGCEVNVSDDPELCTFQFPGIVRRGGMTVALSSGGASPTALKYIREKIEEAIPENFEAVLESMEIARRIAKEMISEQRLRASALRKVFDYCLGCGIQPSVQEIESMIRDLCGAELD